jgi:hypothetical protein
MHGQGATDRMRDYERLREHASRLLALSHKAREEGRHELATELATLAADAYDQAFAMENQKRP